VESNPITRWSRPVSAQVGAYVENLIDNQLVPGDHLPPERELAALLNVSRGSVRQAMDVLEQRRRVQRTQGRGTVVLPRPDIEARLAQSLHGDDRSLADIAELRNLVEPRIAALAATRASGADLERLAQILAESHAGLTPAESLALDVEFHLRLASAAANPLLHSLCAFMNREVQEVRARSHRTRAGRRSSIVGHRALFDAVAAGDAERARQAMVDHLGAVERLITGEPR
jgi:GntR family transcriptional repressor for pyruvate dehydrogenase complex